MIFFCDLFHFKVWLLYMLIVNMRAFCVTVKIMMVILLTMQNGIHRIEYRNFLPTENFNEIKKRCVFHDYIV